MRTTTFVTRIEHDRKVVSAFLADLRNDARWRNEITQVDLVSGSPGEAGATYRESVAWEGIRSEVSLTVSEVVPGSRLVVEAQDPGFRSLYEYQFAPIDDGTEVTLFMSIDTTGPLRLIEPFTWGLITRWVERDLAELDSVLGGREEQLPEPDSEQSEETLQRPTGIFEASGETSRAFLGEVVDNLSEGILLFGREGRIFYANRAVAETLGIPHESVLGRCYDDPAFSFKTVDGRHLTPEETPIAQVLRTGTAVLGSEYQVEVAGRSQLTVSENVVPLCIGDEVVGAALSMTDVTERRQVESQVRYQSRLLDEVRNAVVATDSKGLVVYVNDEAERLFGRDSASLLGGDVMSMLRPHSVDGRSVMPQVMATGDWEGEAVFARPDGSEIPILLSFSRLADEQGRVEGFVGVAADITDIKAAEHELEQKDRAIRQAYVDVVGAVTGGKLVLMTAGEIESALGEPITGECPLGPDSLADSRHEVVTHLAAAPTAADPETAVVAYAEAATNALKHAGSGSSQLFRRGGTVQVAVSDTGPGIDFRLLPKATLLPGFSSAQSLGMGFTIMLDLSDRILLATAPGRTRVVLEFAVAASGHA